MTRHFCTVCGERAINRAPKTGTRGWAANVEPRRLSWSHVDGEAMCPELTSTGYQPSMPTNS